ncbi:hypothetical protein X777_11264 [Ooceraea biroi]|uniref:Uncharacterized protein n=1 Tax=Ooceraea biroi TaxID=2015173 RepID=A0A026W3Y7_OOCBI|nr:hypothetical protein X777_11264 [Ooceraea biroi]
MLTEDQTGARVEHCKDMLRVADSDFIVTIDKTYCFQYEPQNGRRQCACRRFKILLTVFFDSEKNHSQVKFALNIESKVHKSKIVHNSPDLAPCDFWPKLKLSMKGKRYDIIQDIQKTSTAVFEAIPKTKYSDCFKKFFNFQR